MKIIVCGASHYADRQLLSNTLREYTRKNRVSTIVIGNEPGAETLAVEWAMQNKVRLSIVPTKRKDFGENAISERNKEMLSRHSDASAVLHFSGCESSEQLCNLAYSHKIAVDDVLGPRD